MPATDIAFTAAAGAIALALSSTVLAWRFRKRMTALQAELSTRLGQTTSALNELDSATAAFEGALLAIDGEEVRLVWGEAALRQCAAALDMPKADAAHVVSAIASSSSEAEAALKALIREGRPCRFETLVEGGAITVEARPSGATAWIRLSLASGQGSLSSGPFALTVSSLPHPCWILGREGQVRYANPAWLEAVEAKDLEAAIKDGLSFDRSADALGLEALKDQLPKEGFRWVTVKGQRRAWKIMARPLATGQVCLFALDVTEAEDTREALRRHVKAHDETLDHLADAVAIFGPEKRLSFHNRAFETLWDLDPVWLAERPTHSELLDRLRQRRRLPETIDYSGFKARELEFYGATTVAPDDLWSLPDGRTLRVVRQPHPLGGVLLLFSDITGELKLKAQYNSLIKVQSATLDKLSDAVAVFGSDGRVRLMNSAFHAFWAIASDDEAPIDFDGVTEQALPLFGDKGFWLELKGRVTDPDPAARAAAEGELKDTKRRHVAWRTQPLPDGATLIVFSDISAKRALEQAVEARERALAESERLKRDFVGNVSYELRTPLTTILGYSELLQTLGLNIPDKAMAHLSAIQTAAGQLARSIDDVLDMAQIDAGEMGLTRLLTPLEDLLAKSLARALPTAKARKVELELDIAPDATEARLDARRMGQVLDHLMDNALRSSLPGGKIRLKTSRTEAGVKIEVIDNGRGLPFHVQARIFDRFVGREHGGPGLSLALVKALVELHGGMVSVQSEPGAGSSFEILLPEKTIADTFVAEGRVGA